MKAFALLLALTFGLTASADLNETQPLVIDGGFLDELDPNSPDAEALLLEYDKIYEMETGEKAIVEEEIDPTSPNQGCYRQSCKVWAHVSKRDQRLYLYLDGRHVDTWLVSSGTGNRTPNFDRHPNGRMYKSYSSKSYPGGDWNGQGNMPWAVFISGGFAIHGTPKSNWSKLGSKASHGCIRTHPTNGETFYRLTKQHGIRNVWITVN